MTTKPRAPRSRRFGRLSLAVASVAGISLCLLIAWPFLGAITWALTLAILFAPLHERVERRVRHPNIAALLSTAIVIVSALFFFGLLFAGFILFSPRGLIGLGQRIREMIVPPPVVGSAMAGGIVATHFTAMSAMTFACRSVLPQPAGASSEQKSRAAQAVLELIAAAESEVARSEFVAETARLLQLTPAALQRDFQTLTARLLRQAKGAPEAAAVEEVLEGDHGRHGVEIVRILFICTVSYCALTPASRGVDAGSF